MGKLITAPGRKLTIPSFTAKVATPQVVMVSLLKFSVPEPTFVSLPEKTKSEAMLRVAPA